MADYYEQTESLVTPEFLFKQLETQSFWDSNLPLARLSTSTLTLRNFKMNKLNRLSSSIQTQCEVKEKVKMTSLDALLALPALSDLTVQPEQQYDYFRKKQPDRLAIVPFTHLSEVYFDASEQKLHFMLADKTSQVEGALAYSGLNENAIHRLELLGQPYVEKQLQYMVCLRRPEALLPVSLITSSGIDNFYF